MPWRTLCTLDLILGIVLCVEHIPLLPRSRVLVNLGPILEKCQATGQCLCWWIYRTYPPTLTYSTLVFSYFLIVHESAYPFHISRLSAKGQQLSASSWAPFVSNPRVSSVRIFVCSDLILLESWRKLFPLYLLMLLSFVFSSIQYSVFPNALCSVRILLCTIVHACVHN